MRWRSSHHKNGSGGERGMTLVEIIIVLAILGMIAVIAVPNLFRFRVRARAIEALRGLVGIVEFARAEALKRHSVVTVHFNDEMKQFTVFEDWTTDTAGTNDNGLYDAGEAVLMTRLLSEGLDPEANPSTDVSVFDLTSGSEVCGTDCYHVASYGSGGALSGAGGGGGLYFTDMPGNHFRLSINTVTGAARTEKWISGSDWSARREDWVWKYQ